VRSIGDLGLKGFRDPVPCYEVVNLSRRDDGSAGRR
jgi:hypothetical protein